MGFGTSLGNLTWQQPMMNNFSYGWGNNSFNWNTPSWGTSAWTSSSSSKKETLEEYEARIKKENAEKNEKIKTLLAQRQEGNKALQQIQEQKTILNGTVKEDGSVEVKGSIQADGTIKEEKLENMSTGAKIMRGGMNLIKGIGNVCKSFVGVDPKTGKWDPVKCIRNVGIAVGVAALCVFAAPLGAAAAAALGGGAIAAGVGTAVAAIPTALAYGGIATGAYMASKGIYDTAKADTLQEFDQGTQDIGAGAFIGLSSAIGLKGISKTAGVSSTSNGTIMSSVSTGAKNIFVNPWKASSQNFQWAEAGYTLNGLSGAREAVKLGQANIAKNAFTEHAQQLKTKLETQIADVESRYSAATSAKDKALLDLEYDGLVKQYSQFENLPTTKSGWKGFENSTKEYNSQLRSYKRALRPLGKGEVEIHGQKFVKADKKALSEAVSSIKKSLKSNQRQMETLKKERFSSMQRMAGSSQHAAEVNEFGFSNKLYGAPSNWVQSKYYGFSLPKSTFGYVNMLGAGAMYATEPYWALQGAAKASGAMPLNGMYAYQPIQEQGETTVIPAEQYAQAKSGYEAQEKQIKEALAQVESQLKELRA